MPRTASLAALFAFFLTVTAMMWGNLDYAVERIRHVSVITVWSERLDFSPEEKRRLPSVYQFFSHITFLLTGFTSAQASQEYNHLFNSKNEKWYHITDVVNKHTTVNDIIFSPDMEVSYCPPQSEDNGGVSLRSE